MRANRTTFVIAHRLSTVCDADMVIFMDHGRIIEMGGFQELASRENGRFASLLRGRRIAGIRHDRLRPVETDPLRAHRRRRERE